MHAPGSRPLTFAIIGAGLIGPRHAHTVALNHDTELIAVVDPSPSGKQLAESLGTSYHESVSSLVQSQKPDGAIICTPNHTHVALAKELASAGVHILIEKPVSTDLETGKDLLQHLEDTSIKVLVGHHRRFNPYMVTAKKMLSEGKLGDVIAVNGLWATHKPLEYFAPPCDWRRASSAGVILINMIHEVDLLQFLFGPIERVYAEKTKPQRPYEADEGAAMTLRFKSGIVGTFVASDVTPSQHNFESGTGENPLIPKSGHDFYRILGTDGTLSVPDMSVSSHTSGEKTWHQPLSREQFPVPEGVPFELQLAHFVRVIRDEEASLCTVSDGLSALAVCIAIKESLESGKPMTI